MTQPEVRHTFKKMAQTHWVRVGCMSLLRRSTIKRHEKRLKQRWVVSDKKRCAVYEHHDLERGELPFKADMRI